MASLNEFLGQNEQLLVTARQHWFGLLIRILSQVALIAILVSAGFVSKTAFHHPSSVALIGSLNASDLIFLITLVISMFLLTIASGDYLRWHTERYCVTDRRILHIHGMLTQSVMAIPLEHISSIAITQDALAKLFNYGTIEIEMNSEGVTNILEQVSKPHQLKHAIQDARDNYERGYGYLEESCQAVVGGTPFRGADVQYTIEELAMLRDRGILSTAEFEAKKRELLSRI